MLWFYSVHVKVIYIERDYFICWSSDGWGGEGPWKTLKALTYMEEGPWQPRRRGRWCSLWRGSCAAGARLRPRGSTRTARGPSSCSRHQQLPPPQPSSRRCPCLCLISKTPIFCSEGGKKMYQNITTRTRRSTALRDLGTYLISVYFLSHPPCLTRNYRESGLKLRWDQGHTSLPKQQKLRSPLLLSSRSTRGEVEGRGEKELRAHRRHDRIPAAPSYTSSHTLWNSNFHRRSRKGSR